MSPLHSPDDRQQAPALRKAQVLAAQTRMLYDNSGTAIAVTVLAAPAVGYFQSNRVPPAIVLAWLVYMLVLCAGRFVLARRYRYASPASQSLPRWSQAHAVGAALSGLGWGGAGVLLFADGQVMNQAFLAFVVGGMMLGGASLLAPKPESFLAFLLPTGVLPSVRLLVEGDLEHIAMGLLGVLFTASILITTWRFHRTITSSLNLQFENRELVQDLQIAHNQAESLNQELEARVQERTSELRESTVRLQAEIKQRETMEEELLRVRNLESLGVLAGGIAHDFNNLLTVVQGNIDLAKMQVNPDTPTRRILDQTTDACQRAMFLSSQLLTFAKGGAPVRKVTSIAKLIMDAVHLTRAGAPISIDVMLPDDLWAAEVDAGQIGQVFHNILLNAKQSMPEAGIIEVRAENLRPDIRSGADSKPRIRVSFRDYGAGIPANLLPRVFDPYFTTKQGGSGLGLATAHAIVSKHNGRITVESKSGHGTIFHVDLPATEECPVVEPPVEGGMSRGSGRLLVMDDEEALRMLLERILSMLGYDVESARDGAEAIALYEAARAAGRAFDAVLLDVTVSGGMGGVEAAAKLRDLDPSVKLIVSSGYSAAAVMAQYRDFGFDDVVPKPWTPAQLSEAFRRVLGVKA